MKAKDWTGRSAGMVCRTGVTLALLLSSQQVQAAEAPAGTAIPNIARISYQQAGNSREATSNVAQIEVEEELGIALEWGSQDPLQVNGAGENRVPFILTNRGNGHEAFVLDGAIIGLDGALEGFAVAGTGSGSNTGTIERGGNTVELSPGEVLRMVVLVRGTSAGRGTLNVSAHAATGFGRPGTPYPQRGDNGSTAIVGPTTAAATLSRPLTSGSAGGDEPKVTLSKQQQVEASDGTSNPVHGATITYMLSANVSGAGSAQGAVVTDPIPDGTDYVPGSLTLDGAAIADSGNFDASGLAIPLGTVTSGQTRAITFKVHIR